MHSRYVSKSPGDGLHRQEQTCEITIISFRLMLSCIATVLAKPSLLLCGV